MLIDNALNALAIVLDPARFAIICSGIGLGLIIGMMPGIGGLGGLALLIPFTHSMDAHTALAFLIGMWAVTATSDTIPAILFGVPGAIGSAATVLDGYPMAKRGEAGRAFGASFMSSIIGGLFGAVLLAISIPILRPFMLAIGTPELLAVCVLGLTLVASVSQGNTVKGLIVALFGVLIAAVGDEAQSGQLRWTFDDLFDTYLLDGVPIECIALGLFAVPELIDMAIARTNTGSIQQLHGLFHEQMRGVRDVLRNWKLVLNSSTLGVVLGSVPGMGAAVIDWIAYGSAARLAKGASETFGKGDVRGVIAAESANCSREGGALIPTLAFGVPGSPSMALLLGAFLAHGIAPGPKLLDTQLDITYTLVWSLALANVVGAGICFLSANPLARVATLRAGILIPTVLAVCFVGAYQGSKSYGDLVVLVVFGLLGWTMKRYGWARAPLILGFVLGKLIEKYLFISMGRYRFEWLERPGVIAIFAVTGLVLLWPLCVALYRRWKPVVVTVSSPAVAGQGAVAARSIDDIIGPALWVVAFLGFAAAFWTAAGWRFSARLMPQTAATAGIIVVICAGIIMLVPGRQREPRTGIMSVEKHVGSATPLSAKTVYGRFAVELLWLLSFLAAVWLIGLMPAMGLYMFLYMSTAGKTRWPLALIITVSLWIGFYFLFVKLLHVPWPPSLLGDALPDLREWTGRLI
ncbi:MAG TPA: tripartite tricarboxylate transporter permease [Xanthobacteraceae bacterium]|nr:tripartite tricarboxylate transporter permease [Xanthobacteraceae bacterium]